MQRSVATIILGIDIGPPEYQGVAHTVLPACGSRVQHRIAPHIGN